MTREQRYRIHRLRTYFEVEHTSVTDQDRAEAKALEYYAGLDLFDPLLPSESDWLDRTWERVFGPAPQWQSVERQEA